MGCSASKSVSLLGNDESFRVRKKFGRSQSSTPLRSERADKLPTMHYDYHLVALTSSSYGIMKLVEAQNASHHNNVSTVMGAAACPMAYSKMTKSASLPAARHKAALTTWTEMAMGISKLTAVGLVTKAQNLDIEESVKNPLSSDIKSSGQKWDQPEEPETINTWELMAGLDDLTPRPSPLPGHIKLAKFASSEVLQQQANPAPSKGRKLSRSRSLSSIEGLMNVGEVAVASNLIEFEDAGTRILRNLDPAAGPANFVTGLSSCSPTSFSRNFFPAADVEDYKEQVDDLSCTLFDRDILASFAGSVGAASSESATSESEEWCPDASLVSTSASFSKADDEDLNTTQWRTGAGTTQEKDFQNIPRSTSSASSSSSTPDSDAATTWKLSFAKITPIDTDFKPDLKSTRSESRSLITAIPTAANQCGLEAYEHKCPPGGDERVVLYSTSLRGIRKTYEDCNRVRTILQSYVVWIDERDVSMHVEFRNEVKNLLLQRQQKQLGPTAVQVPRVFIMGHYIGGVEEVVELHETDKLGELLMNLQPALPQLLHGSGASYYHCNGCGGIRFVPCPNCNGSCKIMSILITSTNNFSHNNQIIRCPDCNENGLILCPICF